jgi:hypothetical protein
MRYTKHVMAAAFAASMVTATAYAQDQSEATHQHETVKMEDLPSPVKQTLQRESQGKQISSIKKETAQGETRYDVKLMSNGKRETLQISDSGQVLQRKGAGQQKNESQQKGQSEQQKSQTQSGTSGY